MHPPRLGYLGPAMTLSAFDTLVTPEDRLLAVVPAGYALHEQVHSFASSFHQAGVHD